MITKEEQREKDDKEFEAYLKAAVTKHDNDVIEECAKVAEGFFRGLDSELAADVIAQAIRELKESE